jgi:cytidylate kinase
MRYDENRWYATMLWMATIGSYDELARALLAQDAPVRLVGIDGCAGAGKTTFATRLAAAAGQAPIVHTDDFATHADFMQWWPLLLNDVVEPLLAGQAATYLPYDWVARAPGPAVTIEPAPLVVIEGVGACRRAWRQQLAMSIWIEAPRDERLRRGLGRDGEELAGFWREWMAAEDGYVAAEDPATGADLVVDGAATVSYDAAREFVIARATDAAAWTTRTREPG